MRLDSLAQVIDEKLCIGCGACVALSPDSAKMLLDSDGFLVPTGDIAELDTPSAQSVCPGIQVRAAPPVPGGRVSDFLGNVIRIERVHATDGRARFEGSSGGGITAFCQYLLNSNIVDGILHITQAEGVPASVPFVSRTVDQLLAGAGSRYTPSAVLAGLTACDLRRLAVVGRPCEVSALTEMMRMDDDLRQRIVVRISFFCAGLPSARGIGDLAIRSGRQPGDVRFIRFRGKGWPGRTTLQFVDDTDTSFSYDEAWGAVLNRRLHPRCAVCVDATGETADVAFADAWPDSPQPTAGDGSAGWSLALGRSAKGDHLLQDAIQSNYLTAGGIVTEAEIRKMQPSQVRRRAGIVARQAGRRLVGLPTTQYFGFPLLRSTLLLSPKVVPSAFLGSLRRALRRRYRSH